MCAWLTAGVSCQFVVLDPAQVVVAAAAVTGNETFAAMFTCVVAGIPLPLVTWSAGISLDNLNTTIANDTVKYLIEETVSLQGLSNVTTVLTIMDLSKADELRYRCAGDNNVTNLLGVAPDSEAMLTVQGQ